ncbi:hypothetical protein B0I73DRAFT_166304 [Yarrowia lipolytica]|uniref:YALI0F08085p n=2 Tax=Yarrowia lipolytica TaxID=4952 RepID=Q6C2G5_YARLI|nr:YALI0F08085p [Yarrowia lipolytica CLIB122]AOW06837.1 hypothetical protein YALI1_F11417g [Yarrowia lipolytica]QNQ00615.1 Hypothetical protein YALI2_F00160g [Yarrowia lipolytica]RDW42713.1 hypothetical protein B0I73DRAFT_166304 [Yarrowia lipolytica]RDW48589.1 hypothetical protein B0I74DRAFT_106908 [Yarrowia lipolytica]RDW55272.1 hypothetical protein B0I75DRAFT_112792 [Yarrowia lipolytica]|eukprot:XP_505147.1 YALI0F08085p [Yarrowia lipolytica CLIB122]
MLTLALVLDEIVQHLRPLDIRRLSHTNNELRGAIQAKVKRRIAAEYPWISLDDWYAVIPYLSLEDEPLPGEAEATNGHNHKQQLTHQISAAFTRPFRPDSASEQPRKYTCYHFKDDSTVVVQHVMDWHEWQFELPLSSLGMEQKEVYDMHFSAHNETLHAYVTQKERILLLKHTARPDTQPVDHVLIIPTPSPGPKYDCILRIYQGHVFYIERVFVGFNERLDLEAIERGDLNLLETTLYSVDVESRAIHQLCSTKLPEEVFTIHTRSFRNPDAPIVLSNRMLYLCDPDRSYLLVFNLLLKSVRLLLLPQHRTYSRNVYIEKGRYLHFVSPSGGVALDLQENEIRDVHYE